MANNLNGETKQQKGKEDRLSLRDKIIIWITLIGWVFMGGILYERGEDHIGDVIIHPTKDQLDQRYMPREVIGEKLDRISEDVNEIKEELKKQNGD